MSRPAAAHAGHAVAFGPFRLLPARHLLLEGNRPVRLGSRAFAILVALVECAGELVSKEELLARVWPNVFVGEGALRVHMMALRRTLGDGQAGMRFIATIPGRGYRFVAPPSRIDEPKAAADAPQGRAHNLPMLPTRIIGRADAIAGIVANLPQRRFITLVGPGGVGKTTVALAAADILLSHYRDRVCFVNFAPVSDSSLVQGAIAFALGLPISTDRPLEDLLSCLAGQETLLVLDGGEHLIDAVATIAEKVIEAASGVHILATSREPLRAAGEHVQRLRPLELGAPSGSLSLAEALDSPAVQLFVERAGATAEGFALSNSDAATVVEICRRLDGIPLAIEMAATRVDAFGVQDLAAHLDNRFALLALGRRTAQQHQQTLRATLDWSHELLDPRERLLLRRLAVFAGAFTLDAASAVAGDSSLDTDAVIGGIAKLVEKSLLSADIGDVGVRYRLLDTTRVYALEKLDESGELDRVTRQYGEHVRKSRVQATGRRSPD